jgi:dipeptidase E
MIFLMGGNPYYLLYHAQKANVKPVLEKCHKRGKIVFGRSAAAMVLSSGVHYVEEFNQIMQFGTERGNTVGLEDFGGLRFMDDVIFPHYDDFANRVPTMEKRLLDIEQRNDILITRLKNGEGIVQLENGEEVRIAD